jgi:NAD(P)-dependent dehydrogenase (short-subunit alcohol dehydrogenase family)
MSAPSFDLTGKVAIVTGGSRGLGREMVLGFAACGADVVIASRKLDACEVVAREVEETTGRRALAVACHVGDWDDLDRLTETTYEEFGKVDVLVNNAGMSPLYPSLLELEESLWDKVFEVNLKGPFRLSTLVGTRMVEAGRGSIINISSGSAIRPSPGTIPYSSAKAGLNSMTVGLAFAFGPTVRVNCIMSGPFRTDITSGWDIEAFSEQAKTRYALQRIGRPPEIVGAAVYLASDASSFTTGAILRVDGGLQ